DWADYSESFIGRGVDNSSEISWSSGPPGEAVPMWKRPVRAVASTGRGVCAAILLGGTALAQVTPPPAGPGAARPGAAGLPVPIDGPDLVEAQLDAPALGGTVGSGPGPLELQANRPRTPEDIRSFVDTLNSSDAAFEIIVGQSRILSLKVDITAGGEQPVLA